MDYEQLKSEFERIKQEAARKHEEARREAFLEAQRQEEEKRKTQQNWPLVEREISKIFQEINAELLSGNGKITPWTRRITPWSFGFTEEREAYSEDWDQSPRSVTEYYTRKAEIEITELRIGTVGKLYAYRLIDCKAHDVKDEFPDSAFYCGGTCNLNMQPDCCNIIHDVSDYHKEMIILSRPFEEIKKKVVEIFTKNLKGFLYLME